MRLRRRKTVASEKKVEVAHQTAREDCGSGEPRSGKSSRRTKIFTDSSTRSSQDCAWKKRFAFGEQPFPTPRWVLNEDFPPDSKRHGSQTGVTAANGHLLLNAEVTARRSRNGSECALPRAQQPREPSGVGAIPSLQLGVACCGRGRPHCETFHRGLRTNSTVAA